MSGRVTGNYLPPLQSGSSASYGGGSDSYNISGMQTEAAPMTGLAFPQALSVGQNSHYLSDNNNYNNSNGWVDNEYPIQIDDIAYLKENQYNSNSSKANQQYNIKSDYSTNPSNDSYSYTSNNDNIYGSNRASGYQQIQTSQMYGKDSKLNSFLSKQHVSKYGESHQIGAGSSKSNRMDMHTIKINLDRTHQVAKLLADKQRIREQMEKDKQAEYERKQREERIRKEKMLKQLRNSPFAKDILSEYERVSEEIKMNEKMEKQQKKKEKIVNRRIRREIVNAANVVSNWEKNQREERYRIGNENRKIAARMKTTELANSYGQSQTTASTSTTKPVAPPGSPPQKQSIKARRNYGTSTNINSRQASTAVSFIAPQVLSSNQFYDKDENETSIDDMYNDVLITDREVYNEMKRTRENELLILAKQRSELNQVLKSKEIG